MQCANPITLKEPKLVHVPCGRCAFCLENRKNEWIIRLKEEEKNHTKSTFITLTYENKYLKFDEKGRPCVSLRDFQLFVKRIRTKCKIRYYGLAEYGPQTYRPHYHAIIFGLGPGDISFIYNAWSMGLVTCTKVNANRIGYVANYHLNKGIFPKDGVKPFVVMSRKPAIGYSYIDKMKDYHKNNIEAAFYQNNQFKQPLPRYYRDKLYTKMEKELINLKQQSIREEKEAKKDANRNFRNDFAAKRAKMNKIKSKSKENKKL